MQRLFDVALTHHRRGEYAAAAQRYAAILREQPDDLRTLKNLSDVEFMTKHFAAALTLAGRAINLAPDDAMALFHRGRAAYMLRRHGEAEWMLRRAIAGEPSLKGAWYMLGQICRFTGRLDESLECFRRAGIADEPNFDRALTLIAMGLWAEGLADYESRWQIEPETHPPLAAIIPEWHGESLEGKTIALTAEQGFGDTIMLCRFAPKLRGLAGRVIFCVNPELWRLMGRFDGIDVVSDGHAMIQADCWSPMYSAWRWLGLKAAPITGEAYLRVASRRQRKPAEFALTTFLDRYLNREVLSDDIDDFIDIWHENPDGKEIYEFLGMPEKEYSLWLRDPDTLPHIARARRAGLPLEVVLRKTFRVGIVWTIGHEDIVAPRSMPLEAFLALAEIPGVSLVSLQPTGTAELQAIGAATIVDDAAIRGVRDFEDTAHLVERLDLVVTVDTAMVHLCGALGVPCWLLLDYPTPWRWPAEGEITPWYDSVRIFRTMSAGAFAELFERICGELRIIIA